MKIVREKLNLKPKEVEPGPSKTLQEESAEEISETLEAFRNRNQAEQRRRMEATDSEFWCALCFETRAQKEEFLSKLGLMPYGDKYLDGRIVAKRFGIVLENKGSLGPLKIKCDAAWESLSLDEGR